jgi:hypothetical protein|tara:strand:+ start:974 stop:1810 length:837 start_codon:yes stop_codon:yes gene_type:complete
MDYIKEYEIKPYKITTLGEVLFTDDTTNYLRANQQTCEAYGYKFNKATGTCQAFSFNYNLLNQFGNTTNIDSGGETGRETENTILNGESNLAIGNNTNCFISGESHIISDALDNTSIIGGKMGKALRQGEVLIGGGGFNSTQGLLQQSFVQVSGKTTNNSDTLLTTQGDEENSIGLQKNSITAFEVFVTALVTGGSSGTAGHYKVIKITGAVLNNNSDVETLTQSQTTIASNGTTGTAVMDVGGTGLLRILVNGTTNVNISWSASVNLYENATNAATF